MSAAAVPAQPGWLIACGNFLFRHRNALFPAVWLAMLFVLHPWIAFGSAHADALVDLVGILLAASGQALRVSVIGFKYIVRGGVNKQVHADELVTTGLFSLSRNPLYVGNLMIYGGLLLVFNNPWAYLIAGGFFVFAYIAIVAAEEEFLRRKFGAAFDAYCREVPRWSLRWSRLAEVSKDLQFNWKRVIAKDYSTCAAWLLILLVLLAYEHAIRIGGRPEVSVLMVYVGVGFMVILLMLVARWAKKSGRLEG
ncbi:MAG TPA: isoprenylcysteine carboxylmethyltransferase family protein [Solimonas sp.]|nr:isoprenylcysteine carboxylmethyltransferase family protein [Solimonas sp.]